MSYSMTHYARLEEFEIHTLYHTRWQQEFITGVTVRGHTYSLAGEFWPSLLRSFHIAPTAARVMELTAIFRLLRSAAPRRLLKYHVQSVDGGRQIDNVSDPNFVNRPANTPEYRANSYELVH